MVWATVQAEKSRLELETAQTLDPTAENGGEQERDQVGDETMTPEQREMRRSRLSSNNPFAEVVGGGGGANGANGGRKTEEETILEKILLAHSEVSSHESSSRSRIELMKVWSDADSRCSLALVEPDYTSETRTTARTRYRDCHEPLENFRERGRRYGSGSRRELRRRRK